MGDTIEPLTAAMTALRRHLVRRLDLPRARRAEPGHVVPRRPGLIEQASAQARGHQGPAAPEARMSPRFVLRSGSAVVCSSATAYPSARLARDAAQAPLDPDYVARYQAALGDQAGARGLEVRGSPVVVVPGGPGAPAAVTAVVTTWLDVAVPGARAATHLGSTEVTLRGHDVCATVTVTGLSALEHGRVLTRLIRRLADRLPPDSGALTETAPMDWVFWPHEG